KARYTDVDNLSLGMSDDMEYEISAGSTMVSIGTDIFCALYYKKN
ncbi:YggS family pyridoxal phosphate enzyme, partial [Salmonella enterica subsp. enterica serovar Infantis]